MIQAGLIQNAHGDLVTDVAYDFYGLRLATCSLDQRIKIWRVDDNNAWNMQEEWKAHDAAVSKLSWAHPEFGSIIASASFDRTVKIWEQHITPGAQQQQDDGATAVDASSSSSSGPSSRWIERAVLADAKGTVRAVEFAPYHFGLKLATISTDNMLRIYECVEQPSLVSWVLTEELDVLGIPAGPVGRGTRSHANTTALATPTQTQTQTNAYADGDASMHLVAQALQQNLQQHGSGAGAGQKQSGASQPSRGGNREAEGGWCISWCKDKYWGEVIAAGCDRSSAVKIIQINSRRSSTLLTLSPNGGATTSGSATETQTPLSNSMIASTATVTDKDASAESPSQAITSVAWAPSCGRSYHLIATGSKDGHVRIWKVRPGSDEVDQDNLVDGEGEEAKWSAVMIADFEHHEAPVGRVEWNITGTLLSSAGNDGRIRLWKASAGNIWRPAGTVGVEQAEEQAETENKDVEMDA
ncbi:hypothetical protein D9613_008787 [Agrocybe pediades]|uniref:WD40 repeat-like protein n=1 Tax=Agrocybe pediades TaxID=84607 RepID=A0A8H4QS50_9AGAR|nr:hypothetical protein D9613_008787 [Agrocybe pediades]